MVAIKDTEMPNYCNYWDAETRKWIECPIYKSCKHHTSNIDEKPSDCPLVEIIVCKNCSHYTEYKALDGITYVGCDKGHSNLSPNFYCDDAERRAQ